MPGLTLVITLIGHCFTGKILNIIEGYLELLHLRAEIFFDSFYHSKTSLETLKAGFKLKAQKKCFLTLKSPPPGCIVQEIMLQGYTILCRG